MHVQYPLYARSGFARVDLNLLVTLDALLDQRNVTQAARRLGMSQPAASRALARLRRLFGDALLVDGRAGYVLSARAEAIRPVLRRLLAGIGAMLEASPFDPAAATGHLRLLMPDLQAAALAPFLLTRLADEAPALDLDLLPPSATAIEALENDGVDAVVGLIDDAPAGSAAATLRRPLRHADARRTSRRRRSFHARALFGLGHIVVSITGVGPAPVDVALAALGHRRRVSVRVPGFLAAVEIAARST